MKCALKNKLYIFDKEQLIELQRKFSFIFATPNIIKPCCSNKLINSHETISSVNLLHSKRLRKICKQPEWLGMWLTNYAKKYWGSMMLCIMYYLWKGDFWPKQLDIYSLLLQLLIEWHSGVVLSHRAQVLIRNSSETYKKLLVSDNTLTYVKFQVHYIDKLG